MKLNLFKRQRTPAPQLPLTRQGALKQFLGNSATLAKNQGQSMLQDHPTLRRNSLIISTLVLVLSRIAISNASAIQAKGTPDEAHRKKEAIKTTIRELGGWTLGYIVFRAIENSAKMYLQKALDFKTNRSSATVKLVGDVRDEYRRAVLRQPHNFGKLPIHLNDEFQLLQRSANRDAPAAALSEKAAQASLKKWRFGKFANRVFEQLNMGKSPALKKLTGLYNWVPLVAGGIPAVILSGYVLEWFTQNHSQSVIDRFTRGGAPPTPKAPPPPSANASFDAYMQQIQASRIERGLPS